MNKKGDEILVSVSCITYNHKTFIKDALKGFLLQETSFPFEVLIHDDASTDGTSEIILEYKAKYPNLIFPIIQNENQYSKGVRGISRTFNYPRARGKYIALCEGDDYWTDPLKLQKQVEFLENNPDFVLTFHNCKNINQKGETINESKLKKELQRDFSQIDLVNGALVPTLSVVFRAKYLNSPELQTYNVKNSDTFLFSILGKYGKGHYHTDITPAVYRVHDGGVWSKVDPLTRNTHLIDTYKKLKKAHYPHYQTLLSQKVFFLFLGRFRHLKKISGKLENYIQGFLHIKWNRHFFINVLKLHYYLLFKK